MGRSYVIPFSASLGLFMSLVWTIGQTGQSETNAHLCDFARRYFPDVTAECQAVDRIVTIAGWLAIFGVVLFLGSLALRVSTWAGWKRAEQPDTKPTLEIHFDPTNPSRRFWSFESPRDENGTVQPGLYHEYRVAVFNPTAQTIRNVVVTVESLGDAGFRPMGAMFDREQAPRRDINPGCFELVPVLKWPHPKAQPGMLAGPSAIVGYGPLVVTASGDDAAPAQRTFWLDYQREPMLFDKLEPGEWESARARLTRL